MEHLVFPISLMFTLMTVAMYSMMSYDFLFTILSASWYVLLVLFQMTRHYLVGLSLLGSANTMNKIPSLPPGCDFAVALSLSWGISLNLLTTLQATVTFELALILLLFSFVMNAFALVTIWEWRKPRKIDDNHAGKPIVLGKELLYDVFRPCLIQFCVWTSAMLNFGMHGVIGGCFVSTALAFLSFYDHFDKRLRNMSVKTHELLKTAYFALALSLGLMGVAYVSPEAHSVLFVTAVFFSIVIVYSVYSDLKK